MLEAANILEQRAQDPSGALGYLCRAFELDPTPELEAELRRLARSSGEWGVAVAGYQRAIDRCKDPERGRELRYARGQILEEKMEDREAALACYRQIVEGDPAAAVRFMFSIDMERISAGAALEAVGLGFFSIGVGLGVLITYAAYAAGEIHLTKAAVVTVVADTAISFLAGFTVFPILFAG